MKRVTCAALLGLTMLSAGGAPLPTPPMTARIPVLLPWLGDLHFAKTGSVANENFGGAVVVGDINGDNRDDVLISSVGIGTCFVVSGSDGSILRTLTDPGIYWPIYSFGAFLGATGDVNGDGVPDMSVGTIAGTGGAPPVYVFDGATGGVIWSKKVLYGAAEGVGDLNGDGKSDVVIRDGNGSVIRAYRGDTGTLLWSKTGYRCYGMAVMTDVTGDGVPDLAVGDTTGGPLSRVVVLSGANGAFLYHIVVPSTASNYFGSSIAAPGDLNQDGVQDLLIGDLGFDGIGGNDSGRIYQYSGTTLVRTWDGSIPVAVLGRDIEIAGDADKDGFNDFLALEQGVSTGIINRVFLFSGKTGLPLHVFDAEMVGGDFGVSLSGKANFNGDGYSDFVIGAPTFGQGGSKVGKAYFYLGGKP